MIYRGGLSEHWVKEGLFNKYDGKNGQVNEERWN